jgi:Transposase DDE domain
VELTTIFYYTDEFCKLFEKAFGARTLSDGKGLRDRGTTLSTSEVMTILIYYHFSGYKNFKSFYTKCEELRSAFRPLPSYNRFIELQQKVVLPLALFAKICSSNPCDGFSFMDSFSLSVSHEKRVYSHKTFRGLAKRGKTSMGWFFGFKVHVVINKNGEIIDFVITPGNVADNNLSVIQKLLKNVWGKIFGDKGYLLNQNLWQKLYLEGKQVITKIRSNMKNKLVELADKVMLKKRGVVESVGAVLKEDLNIEHSRYRSPITLFINVFSALIAYQFRPKKPSIVRDKHQILASVA